VRPLSTFAATSAASTKVVAPLRTTTFSLGSFVTLETTIAGSLPKPSWLAAREQLWAGWVVQGEELAEAKRDAVRLAVIDQERAGLQVITDGEQTRQHFVTTFIEGLDGVDAVNRAMVRIRRRYDASVPRVVGEVARTKPVYVEDAKLLRSSTDRRTKTQLPGPMTIVDTLQDDHYGDREELAMVFADAPNAEAREIAAAGVDIIQFDEPAFNVFLDEVGYWGIAALERAIAGVEAITAVHICYGYGVKANIDWKRGLGPEWRQYEVTFPLLAESSIDQISLEIAGSNIPLDVLDLLGDKTVQAGVIDVATDNVETPGDVAGLIEEVAARIPPDRIYPSTNCGMVPLSRETASAKMLALSEGTRLVSFAGLDF
jgi:5-methyltetrahydropteroyltriglutamate--homocysteine methyltransferase